VPRANGQRGLVGKRRAPHEPVLLVAEDADRARISARFAAAL
jgi:hypothetical protein